MAIKPQGIAGLNVGDTNTLLNQMGKPKSLGDLAELYKQGILGQGPLKSKFVPPVGRFKTAPGQSTGMGYLKDIANFGLSGVDLFNQGIGAISAVTNPSGNLIGDYLSQEDPDSFEKRKFNVTGPEVFLPDENRNIYGAFSPEGQKRLFDQSELAEEENAIAGESDTGSDELQKRLSKIAESTDVSEEEKGIAGELTSEDVGGTGEAIEGADTDAKKATVSALNDFLKGARPGVNPKTFDEYINEFGDATGLDISGEADTKQALMSFGLALMQNRAGKGFDISKILTATGEAGEAAMPDFRKAVAESKAVRAKAGEYALGKTKEDKNAAMNRKNYYIVPKGKKGGLKGIASNLDKGQFSMLNSYELNNLTNNKEFNEQYEIVPNSTYEKVLAATIKTPEWGEKYLTKYEDIPLFNNAGDDFKIPVQRLNGNYKGPDKPKQGFFNPEKYDDYYGRFKRMDTGLNKVSDQLGKAFKISSDGKLNFGGQVADDIKGFAQAFGLSDQKATDKDQVLYILNSVAAKNAPKILGEAGKTISDSDRDRVQVIVGKLEKTSSPAALRLALQEVYELIVVEGKRDVRQGLSTLNRYSGRKDPNFEKKSLSSEVNEQGVYQVSDQ
jgi:hypothetical protein